MEYYCSHGELSASLKMIRSLIVSFAFILCGTPAAQSTLEPCREAGDPYHAAVNQVIDKVVAKPSRLQLTTFPSFQTESGIRLVGSDVYFVEFQSSYWGDSVAEDGGGSYHMDFRKPRPITKVRRAPLGAAAGHGRQILNQEMGAWFRLWFDWRVTQASPRHWIWHEAKSPFCDF